MSDSSAPFLLSFPHLGGCSPSQQAGGAGRGGVKVCNYTPPDVGEKELGSLAIHNENEGFVLKIKQKQHAFKRDKQL